MSDKRCITALANSTEPSLVSIRERLASKVVCLEQLILKIIVTENAISASASKR